MVFPLGVSSISFGLGGFLLMVVGDEGGLTDHNLEMHRVLRVDFFWASTWPERG
jgi:hypothetical protein